MKFLTILMLGLLTIGTLSACNVTAKDGNDSLSVSDGDHYEDGKCPPGHHMKGWC